MHVLCAIITSRASGLSASLMPYTATTVPLIAAHTAVFALLSSPLMSTFSTAGNAS
jgi:hypothetical protein